MDSGIQREFPSLEQFAAIDCRTSLQTVADFQKLPFSVAFSTQLNIITQRSRKTLRDIVTPGPIGCSQSHLSIWAQFAGNSEGWLVVFESDVRASHNLNYLIQKMTAAPLPSCLPGIIKLGHTIMQGHTRPVAPELHQITGGTSGGTHAYIIQCKLLSEYVRMLTPIGDHIDGILTDLAAAGASAPMWITTANMCTQPMFQLNSIHSMNFNFRVLLPENTYACNAVLFVPSIVALMLLAIVIWLCCRQRQGRLQLPVALSRQ